MEFMILDPLMFPCSCGHVNVYLVVAGVLWILACSNQDAMFLEWFRGVLALAIKCLKAALTAVPREAVAGRPGHDVVADGPYR